MSIIAVQKASVTLSSAQLKALRGAPIPIIVSPGTGQAIMIVWSVANYSYGGTAYVDPNGDADFQLWIGTTEWFDFGNCSITDTKSWLNVPAQLPSSVTISAISPGAVTLKNGGTADLTTGNGMMTVTIAYIIIPVS